VPAGYRPAGTWVFKHRFDSNMVPKIGFWARLRAIVLLIVAHVAVSAWAGAESLLILHTNDLHDHVRPGYNGVGGIPYVAAYIKSVRAERGDVLLLDAGDVVEKGDMVASRTHGELTFSILSRMGYDALTLGNHDNDQGLDQLRRYEQALGQGFVCLNRVGADGSPLFEPSRVVKVGPLRIGIIGLIVPQDEGTLDFAESGRRLGIEAERLAKEADLVVALCHHSSRACAEWSRMAPEVDVFVSGHSHEALKVPVVVPETGALIVQAGSYAKWVGRLELEVDTDADTVRVLEAGLVPMTHDTNRPDTSVVDWVRETEAQLCPEAAEELFVNDEPVGAENAWLAADAMRRQEGVDVGFCHPGHILRHYLPAGRVDVNALFLTGGQRGHRVVRTSLTGAEIGAYITALAAGRDQTAWSGFALVHGDPDTIAKVRTTLEPDREYSVVMPEMEWSKRFLRAATRAKGKGPLGAREFSAEPAKTSYTDALHEMLKSLPREQRDVQRLGAQVRRDAGMD
jgi:2',3'-cyclic-nucleotide 2'-phosphodiesterase (5'-nucleotidase family)